MPRIVRRSRERLLIEMYEGMLRERERIVMSLAEQVEYLRAQLQMPTSTVSRAVAPPVLDFSTLPKDMQVELTGVQTDEEDELQAMLQADVITQAEYDDHIERLRRQSPDDIIE